MVGSAVNDESTWFGKVVDELKRRKVIHVAVVYALVGWVLIQIADASFGHLNLPPWSQTLVVVMVALGFPVALVMAWALEVTPGGVKRTVSERELPPPSNPETPQASIAVIPFANISGDPDNEYFSDGLSEELLNLLARIPELRVCSRTSSFAFKGKDADMKTIRDCLDVGTVLEGSVRRSGGRVRITAQLIDARSDSHLWSRSYDRDMLDIFAVQDEIAASIVKAMHLTLKPDTWQRLELASTDNVEAYDLYLQGREFYHRADKGHLKIAHGMFEKAIEADPTYAAAWSGLAISCADHWRYHGKSARFLERAEEASRTAVKLGPELAESHTARGLALWCAKRFDEAEEAFKSAIDINPSLFEPFHFYARMLRMEGLKGDYLALFEHATCNRPEDFQSRVQLACLYEELGRKDESQAKFREAVQLIESYLSVVPEDVRALYLGSMSFLRLAGERDRAYEWMERALSLQPDHASVLYNGACFYAVAGQPDRALDLLEKSVDSGMAHSAFIARDPDLESLHDTPRFTEILARLEPESVRPDAEPT